MGSCIACSGAKYSFECAHCGESVCKKHWTPEDHNCVSLTQEVTTGSGVGQLYEERKSPEPMDLSETNTPVKESSEVAGPSPDVAADGSLVEDSGDDWESEPDQAGGFFDFQMSGEAVYVSIKAYIRYMVGLAGLALVLIGCYNLFSPAIGNAYFITIQHVARPVLIAGETNAFPIYVSDVAMIGVGAMLAWYS